MTDADETNKIGVMRLVEALNDQASFAINYERLPPDILTKFEQARRDLLPALKSLIHAIDHTERPEDGYEAVWRLISCTATLIDPEANKLGVAAALKVESNSRYGKNSARKARAKSWRSWRKQAAQIAKNVWMVNPKLTNADVERLIRKRFKGRLVGEKYVLEYLSKLRKRLIPSPK